MLLKTSRLIGLFLYLFIIYTGLMSYGLFSPAESVESIDAPDMVLHFIGFAGFAFITRLAFARHAAWKVWIPVILWAPASEFLQQLQPTRGFDWLDIAANLAGVMAGALCWWLTVLAYRILVFFWQLLVPGKAFRKESGGQGLLTETDAPRATAASRQ